MNKSLLLCRDLLQLHFQVSRVCFVGIKAIFKFSVPIPHWYVITEMFYVQNNIRCACIV